MKIFKKQLALPLILAVIFLGGIAFYVSQKNGGQTDSDWQQVLNSGKRATPTMIQEEFDADGIYENYTYGFSFQYPQQTFNKSNPWDESTGKTFFIDSQISPVLRVQKLGSEWSATYESCVNAKNGEIISQSAKLGTQVKLRSIANGCVVASDPRKLQGGEPSWSYTAYFNQNEQLIAVTLSTVDEKTLVSYKPQFDTLVNSFKFIASNN